MSDKTKGSADSRKSIEQEIISSPEMTPKKAASIHRKIALLKNLKG